MSNKKDRETKEMKSLFNDPKFSRKAFQSIGMAILKNPAVKHVPIYDKDGNETFNSLLTSYSYEQLKRDILKLTEENREPTELEMIMQCNIIRARYDTGAAIFVRDTLGAKPIDESKIDQNIYNDYAGMTDEELEMLQKHRELKILESRKEEQE